MISWQNEEIQYELTQEEQQIVNGQNSQDIINYLTNMLLGEIQNDLFPMRGNTSQLLGTPKKEIIQEKAIYTKKDAEKDKKKSPISASKEGAGSALSPQQQSSPMVEPVSDVKPEALKPLSEMNKADI